MIAGTVDLSRMFFRRTVMILQSTDLSCSHFIDLVVKEHAHKTSELLILFYGEMSENSESLRGILGQHSDIVVKHVGNIRKALG